MYNIINLKKVILLLARGYSFKLALRSRQHNLSAKHRQPKLKKLTCRTCSFAYVGESKRSWKSRGAKHKPGTNANINSAIKHHAEIGHHIHPSYAEILKTGVSSKNKILFLEPLHSFLDKNTVNERTPFPRVYASLIAPQGGNKQ